MMKASQDRLGSDDADALNCSMERGIFVEHHRLEDRRAPTIKLDEEQAIAVRELGPTGHLALQHDQLTPKCGILRFKSAVRFEQGGQQPQKET